MNTITRQAATKVQLIEIEGFIYAYMSTLEECLKNTEECGLSIVDNIKMILGFGVKSAALGKFENLNVMDKQITFGIWIRVNLNLLDFITS